MFIGIGIGIPFSRVLGGGIGQTIAANHHARVIADSGVMPVTVAELAGLLNPICTAYGITTEAQFITQFPTFSDPHWTGYRLGAGSGATLGQAARNIYSINPAADAVQTTAASQPLLLAWSGQNYWYGSGVAGNFVSTPNISITTSAGMSIECNVGLRLDAVYASNWIASIDNGASSRNLFLGFTSPNRSLIIFWANLTRQATSTVVLPNGFNGWIKASLETVGADMHAKFFTSNDGITYTQLGTTVISAGGANTYQTTGAQFNISGNGGANVVNLRYNRVLYRNANGTLIVDFNPQLYNAATSQTQWTSATGEVWSINTGTAATGYKGVLVDRTITQGDGVDDLMTQPANFLNFVDGSVYSCFRFFELLTANRSALSLGVNPNEMDFKPTTNRINNVAFFASRLNLNIAVLIRNESALQGIGQINNEALITNAIPALGVNMLKTFMYSSPYLVSTMGILNTTVVSTSIDTTAQRLIMFNTLKTMNKI